MRWPGQAGAPKREVYLASQYNTEWADKEPQLVTKNLPCRASRAQRDATMKDALDGAARPTQPLSCAASAVKTCAR